MRFPRTLARYNRRVTNPIVRRWAGAVAGFGIIEHVGRKSGRGYRTPVNVFAAQEGGFAILLLYGTQSDWLRNLLAAGEGTLVHRRRRYLVRDIQIVTGSAGQALLPWPERIVSRVLHNDDVLHLSTVSPARSRRSDEAP